MKSTRLKTGEPGCTCTSNRSDQTAWSRLVLWMIFVVEFFDTSVLLCVYFFFFSSFAWVKTDASVGW